MNQQPMRNTTNLNREISTKHQNARSLQHLFMNIEFWAHGSYQWGWISDLCECYFSHVFQNIFRDKYANGDSTVCNLNACWLVLVAETSRCIHSWSCFDFTLVQQPFWDCLCDQNRVDDYLETRSCWNVRFSQARSSLSSWQYPCSRHKHLSVNHGNFAFEYQLLTRLETVLFIWY